MYHQAVSEQHWGKRKLQGIFEIEACPLHKKQCEGPFVQHVHEFGCKPQQSLWSHRTIMSVVQGTEEDFHIYWDHRMVLQHILLEGLLQSDMQIKLKTILFHKKLEKENTRLPYRISGMNICHLTKGGKMMINQYCDKIYTKCINIQ